MVVNVSGIGMKIKQLREKANLTQKQIADFLLVDQSLISKFEKGECSISSDALDQLAALFCCPVSALVSDEEAVPVDTIVFQTAARNIDLSALTVINRIALNQFRMDQIAGGAVHD